MPVSEYHRSLQCFGTVLVWISELCSDLFFSLGLQTKGDVHGGGEGVQHWTGHCYAADQAEGNSAEYPQEARLLLRRVREYCAVPPAQGTSVPPRGQNPNGSAPTQMFSAWLPGYTFSVAGIVLNAGCVHHLPRRNSQQQRMAAVFCMCYTQYSTEISAACGWVIWPPPPKKIHLRFKSISIHPA